MRSFNSLRMFNDLPTVVDDIIWDFAYGMSRTLLSVKASEARTNTYNMPVPTAWKNFFRTDFYNRVEFDWMMFLADPEASLICTDAVTESLNLLNWNALRAKGNAVSMFVRTSTKTNLKARLQDEYLQNDVVHMVWHLLTCAGRGDFTTHAWRNNNYNRFLAIPYFNRPLSAYYPPGPSISAWDMLVMRNHDVLPLI